MSDYRHIYHPKYGNSTILKVEKTEEGYIVIIRTEGGEEKMMFSLVNPLGDDADEFFALSRKKSYTN